MNAFTTREYTAFYLRVLSANLDLGLDVLSDIMWAPAFRPNEVEAERQVILEEILMHNDEPADLVHEVFGEALYPGDALGREVLGDESTVTELDRDAHLRLPPPSLPARQHRPGRRGRPRPRRGGRRNRTPLRRAARRRTAQRAPPPTAPSGRSPWSTGPPNRPIWSSVCGPSTVTTRTATPSR